MQRFQHFKFIFNHYFVSFHLAPHTIISRCLNCSYLDTMLRMRTLQILILEYGRQRLEKLVTGQRREYPHPLLRPLLLRPFLRLPLSLRLFRRRNDSTYNITQGTVAIYLDNTARNSCHILKSTATNSCHILRQHSKTAQHEQLPYT